MRGFLEVLPEAGKRDDQRAGRPVGPQASVHTVKRTGRGVTRQCLEHALGNLGDELLVRDGPAGSRGRAVLLVEKHQIEIAVVIELAAAQLAQGEHGPAGRSLRAGAPRGPRGCEVDGGACLIRRRAHGSFSRRFASAREGSRTTVWPNSSPRGMNVRSAVTTVTPRSTWRAMIVSPSRSHQPHDGARAFVFAASSACSDWRTKPGLDASLDRTSGLVRSISLRRRR